MHQGLGHNNAAEERGRKMIVNCSGVPKCGGRGGGAQMHKPKEIPAEEGCGHFKLTEFFNGGTAPPQAKRSAKS